METLNTLPDTPRLSDFIPRVEQSFVVETEGGIYRATKVYRFAA
jgi:hypothetical protein